MSLWTLDLGLGKTMEFSIWDLRRRATSLSDPAMGFRFGGQAPGFSSEAFGACASALLQLAGLRRPSDFEKKSYRISMFA